MVVDPNGTAHIATMMTLMQHPSMRKQMVTVGKLKRLILPLLQLAWASVLHSTVRVCLISVTPLITGTSLNMHVTTVIVR
ncbi:MAG: hypothetical protein WDA42_05525 [Candidatus Bathyarchaeia archaeon]